MHLEEIGAFIRARRKLLGITQADLAELSDTGLRTIKALEQGQGNPTVVTLTRVAEVLGLQLQLVVRSPPSA